MFGIYDCAYCAGDPSGQQGRPGQKQAGQGSRSVINNFSRDIEQPNIYG